MLDARGENNFLISGKKESIFQIEKGKFSPITDNISN
jgi:hypothetical protein